VMGGIVIIWLIIFLPSVFYTFFNISGGPNYPTFGAKLFSYLGWYLLFTGLAMLIPTISGWLTETKGMGEPFDYGCDERDAVAIPLEEYIGVPADSGYGYAEPGSIYGYAEPGSAFGYAEPGSAFGYAEPGRTFGYGEPV